MARFTDEDDALLAELGVETETAAASIRSAREERVIAGFEDIQRFIDENGHAPRHGEDRDIFERLYAVRLDRLRAQPDCRAILAPLDRQGLLSGAVDPADSDGTEVDDDALLEQLGVNSSSSGISELTHVRSSAEKRAAEEIANREKCRDFERFEPLFAEVRADLSTGLRQSRPFNAATEIQKGDFFIVGGQVAYVAEVGEEFVTDYERRDSRLRVIYDNGTESNVLRRSLERALHRDEAGRRITALSAGPLFGQGTEEGDLPAGTIYVLRSKSDHPTVTANREVVHKIGVTGGDVERRFSASRLDPTFLMADVEIVATYKLANLNRTKLEALIHRVFGPARLEINIKDRFGSPIVPREWFLVPLFVIDEAVERIRDGSIVDYSYDPTSGRLTKASGPANDAPAAQGRRRP